ncbi:MAG: ACT domain-containing protein [Bacillota bacterium]|nr:ACT domain-containing protein [Bacillota bacterium]MDW7682850.1 ACT domain-containing protein [Bacillota bacterium]
MNQVSELLKNTHVRLCDEEFFIVGCEPGERQIAVGIAGEDGVVSLVFLPREVTIILTARLWQRVGGRFNTARIETGYRLITLDISLPWDVVGYLARVTEALAAGGVSVGVISSYASDHLLVGEEVLPAALRILKNLGCRV